MYKATIVIPNINGNRAYSGKCSTACKSSNNNYIYSIKHKL